MDFETYYNGLRKQAKGNSQDDDFTKFYDGLKMDIGAIPDTRPPVVKPSPSQQMQQQYGSNFPSFDASQSPVMKQAAQYAASNPQPAQQESNVLDYIFKDNPVARVLNYPFAKIAEYAVPDAPLINQQGVMPGTNARQSFMQQNPIPSTGSDFLDKAGDVAGQLIGPMVGTMGTGIGAIPGYIDRGLTQAGVNFGTGIGGRVAKGAVEGALSGAPMNAAATLATTDPSLNSLAESANQGILFGGVLGGAGGAAGYGISKAANTLADKYAGTRIGDALGRLTGRSQSVAPEAEQASQKAVNTYAQQYKEPIGPQTANDVHGQIMQDVSQRITPPTESPKLLDKYLYYHLGKDVPRGEIDGLSYNDKIELANHVRDNLSVHDTASQIANERGYNWNDVIGQSKAAAVPEKGIKGNPIPTEPKAVTQPERMPVSQRLMRDPRPESIQRIRQVLNTNALTPYEDLFVHTANGTKLQVHSLPFGRVQPKEVVLADGNTMDLNAISKITDGHGKVLYDTQEVKVNAETPKQPELIKTVQPKQTVQNERGFISTLKQSDKPPEGFKERLKASYQPVTNQRTVEMANKRIGKDVEDAASYVLGKSKFSAEKVTTAHRLIDEFNKQGNYQRAVDIAEKIAEEGTRAGQTVQAFSIYNRLTPEGVLVHAQRIAKQTNEALPVGKKEVQVTADMAAKLTDFAGTVQKMTGVRELASDVVNILEKAKSGKALDEAETAQLRKFVEESRQFVKEVAEKPKAPRPPRPPQDKRVRDNMVSFLDAQEAAAKERLRARGIRVSSTPIDVWADYAIIGAAKMGKGVVKLSDWSEAMVKEFGEEIRPHLNNLYEKARDTFELSAKKVSQSTYNRADKIVERVLKSKAITPEEATNIRQMAEQVLNLSGDAKRLANQDLQAILQTLEKPGMLKRISSVQTMAQLMNPKTLLVRNPLGNELFYRVERINKLVAAPIDWGRVKLFGGQRAVTFRTHNQGEYWKNWLTGLRAGWKGVNVDGLQTQFDVGPAAFNGKWNPLTYMEKALGASLKSFDYAAYKRAVNNTIGEMATLRAMNEGLTGEGKKMAIQKYIREVDDHVLSIADQYGKYVTFQDNNVLSKGLTGLKRGLNFGKDFGFGDLIIKYPKTPGALLMRALEYSPAGFLRSISIAARPIYQKGAEPNTPEAMMALTRAITGTFGLSGLGMFLLDKGILTGSANKDRDIRDLEQSAGRGQYQVNTSALVRWLKSGFNPAAAAIQVGDNLYTYDWMQPVSMAVSMGANAAKSRADGEDKGSAALNLAGTAYNSFEGGVNSLVEQSVLSGVKRAFEGYPGQTVMDKVVDVLSEVPASFVPSALNQAKQMTDNARRETYSPDKLDQSLNKAKAKVPGIAGTLPQQYDTLGKPKETYQNNNAFNVLLNPGFSSKYELSPEARMIVDLIAETGNESLAPRVPSKSISYKDDKNQSQNRKLTTEEFARIQRLQGEETQKQLSRISDGLSTNSKVKRVQDGLSKAGETAKKQLKKEIGVR